MPQNQSRTHHHHDRKIAPQNKAPRNGQHHSRTAVNHASPMSVHAQGDLPWSGHGSKRQSSIIAEVALEDGPSHQWAPTGWIRSIPRGPPQPNPRFPHHRTPDTRHATTAAAGHDLARALPAPHRCGHRLPLPKEDVTPHIKKENKAINRNFTDIWCLNMGISSFLLLSTMF